MSSTDDPTRDGDLVIVVNKSELHELHDDVISHIKRLSQEMDSRFEQVDKRFEQVDKRFEQVDRRFEQVDRRFDAIDARFEAQDRRLEAHEECFTTMESNIAHIVTIQQSQEKRLVDVSNGLGKLTRNVARLEGGVGTLQQSQARQLALLEDIRARLS